MDDIANAADDERSVRRPLSRHFRRGPYALSRASSQLMASKSFDALNSPEPDSATSPLALRRTRSFVADVDQTGLGSQEVLGEVSSNSTRKRTKPTFDPSKSLGAGDHEALENIPPLSDRSVSHPVPRNAPRQATRRSRVFGLRGNTHQRVDSSDPQRYIESLEAQVASLQTQLQSSSSPSLQRSNSSKLRALNAETKLLRQEVTEWEHTFNDRVREHVEQYELVAGSLRARIRFLEKERDTKDQTIEALESDISGKSEAFLSLEAANRALERRLDATLQQLHGPDRHPHIETSSPGATEVPGQSSSRSVPMTPASAKSRQSGYNVSSPVLSPHSRQFSEASTPYDNPFDSGAESSKDSGYVTELASEASEGHNYERYMGMPGRPVSWAPSATGEGLQRSRPSQRRMRRFYTGNVAQSLLLPAARSAGDAPLSAPLPAASGPLQSSQIPVLTSPIRERFPIHSPKSSRGSISLDFRQRSATIDETSDPIKSDLHRRHEQTPRGPTSRHARTATDGSIILTPDHTRYLPQFHFARSERESHGSDTTRPDSAAHNSDSDPSIIPHALSPPTSPLRFGFGPALNIDEVVAAPRAPSKSPTPTSTRRPPSRGRPRPRTRLGRLVAQVQHAFEAHTYAARYLFASTWADLALARPVLEFRVWLVRVLLGRLRDRGSLVLLHRAAGRASASNPAGLGLRVGVGVSPVALGAPRVLPIDEDALLEALAADDDVDGVGALPPFAPPVHWLRFSMTLVAAVGVAIADGPATLFPGAARRGVEGPVHRRGGSLLHLLMPAGSV